MKQCRRCLQIKPLEEFYKRSDGPDGRQYTCISCMKVYAADKHAENRDDSNAKHRDWYRVNRESESERKRLSRLADRNTVFDHYGRKCACCGESNQRFMTVDHVENDGAEHRKTVRPEQIFRWLIRNHFPTGFQILCFNCNCGKALNGGVCPHMEADL